MKINKYFILFLMAVMALTACKKYVENPVAGTKSTQQNKAGVLTEANGFNLIDTVVYVSGGVYDTLSNHNEVVYWKNGVMTRLSDPNVNCYSSGIVVIGPNVYASGYYITDAGVNTAVYWINGLEKRLPDNTRSTGIAVNSVTGSVYIAGVIINGFDSQAAYWQDGIQIPLVTASTISYANAISLSGTDVYIAGEINKSPVYWKNGVAINLSSGSRGTAQAIFSDGTNVYTAGYVIAPPSPFSPPGVTTATFWTNGLAKQLTDVSTYADAYGIAVSTTNAYLTHTYVVGYQFIPTTMIGTYWQDGVPKTIQGSSALNAIALLGNDVYIAGFANGTAAYWKNGVIKKLANGQASGIQVVAARKPVPVGRQ